MKIKQSIMTDDMRGKAGSIVASKGRGGNYFRARVVPFNPKSVAQVASRARLTTYTQGWSALSESDRSAWNAAVDQWKNTDVFGNSLTPSGHNLYVALNCNLALAGEAAITVPPAVVAVPVLATLSATAVHAGAVIVTFTATPLAANTKWVFEATEAMSQGRSSAGSKYRVVKVIAAGQTSPQTITTEYNAKFGSPAAADLKVFFRVYGIDTASGRKGAPLTCIAITT
jgi:hypothetical protein